MPVNPEEIKARYESINKSVLSKLDKVLFDAMPKEVFHRLLLDLWVEQNPIAKLLIEAVLRSGEENLASDFEKLATAALNENAAKMWHSAHEWGTTQSPLPEEFRHYLESEKPMPVTAE